MRHLPRAALKYTKGGHKRETLERVSVAGFQVLFSTLFARLKPCAESLHPTGTNVQVVFRQVSDGFRSAGQTTEDTARESENARVSPQFSGNEEKLLFGVCQRMPTENPA